MKAIENGSLEIKIKKEILNTDQIAFFDYLSFILDNEEAVDFDFKDLKRQTTNHFELSVRGVIDKNLFIDNHSKNLSERWRKEKNKLTTNAINVFNNLFKNLSIVRRTKDQNNRPQEIRYSYNDIFGYLEDPHNLSDEDIHQSIMSLKNKSSFLTDGFLCIIS